MDWIAKRILEARTAAPVGDPVASRVEKELVGTMRERSLRPAELAELARGLIAATGLPKSEAAP